MTHECKELCKLEKSILKFFITHRFQNLLPEFKKCKNCDIALMCDSYQCFCCKSPLGTRFKTKFRIKKYI